jgi:hypothetical protein
MARSITTSLRDELHGEHESLGGHTPHGHMAHSSRIHSTRDIAKKRGMGADVEFFNKPSTPGTPDSSQYPAGYVPPGSYAPGTYPPGYTPPGYTPPGSYPPGYTPPGYPPSPYGAPGYPGSPYGTSTPSYPASPSYTPSQPTGLLGQVLTQLGLVGRTSWSTAEMQNARRTLAYLLAQQRGLSTPRRHQWRGARRRLSRYTSENNIVVSGEEMGGRDIAVFAPVGRRAIHARQIDILGDKPMDSEMHREREHLGGYYERPLSRVWGDIFIGRGRSGRHGHSGRGRTAEEVMTFALAFAKLTSKSSWSQAQVSAAVQRASHTLARFHGRLRPSAADRINALAFVTEYAARNNIATR